MTAEHRGIPVLQELQDSKYLTVNLANAIFEALISPTAVAIVNTPPLTVQTGQKWVVGNAPSSTSVFSGHSNEIAIYITGGVWRFIAPENGMILYLATSSFAPYRFNNNTWTEVADAGVPQSVLNRITANDAKVGVSQALLNRVTANDAKVGVPDGLLDTIAEKLDLGDFFISSYEHFCNVTGADTIPSGIHRASLSLVCDGETPTQGVADLGGVIRFTANSAWNGKFTILNLTSGGGPSEVFTATQISGGNTGLQGWRFDGVEWDFSHTNPRIINLADSSSIFTPALPDNSFTFEFNGEITRGTHAGQAVATVEAIIGEYLEENPVDSVSPSQATAIAKIPAIETKSNNNETAISGLQTTTGELTTAQGATRTIADNNTTEIATIRALIPTDGISGVGDLTALETDIEANQSRITDAETKNMEQDSTLTELATKNTHQDEAIALNTAKTGTTPTERTRIATIPALTNRVTANDAKPTNSVVDTRADNRIDASLVEGGAVANYVKENAGAKGALALEDLALETTERLCGVNGADAGADDYRITGLNLECDGETPTEGVAILGGNIRFTTNSAWNGKFRITDNALLNIIGTATHISGGGGAEQVWRIDGVEWDFTNTSRRSILLDQEDGSVFIPAVDDLTFTFDGELTHQVPGQAVAPVEAIVEKSIVESLEEGGAVATYVLDNAGSVTAPTISAFYVNAIEQNAPRPNFANINMATPDLNQGGDMSTAGVYTAPETGVYWMSYRASVLPFTNNTTLQAGLSVDNATPSDIRDAGEYTSSGTRARFVIWAGAIPLTKGQTIQLQANTDNRSDTRAVPLIAKETYFSGYLIGVTG